MGWGRGLLEFQPRLLFYAFQGPGRNVFYRVGYGDFTGFRKVLELVVVTLTVDFVPAVGL